MNASQSEWTIPLHKMEIVRQLRNQDSSEDYSTFPQCFESEVIDGANETNPDSETLLVTVPFRYSPHDIHHELLGLLPHRLFSFHAQTREESIMGYSL